MPRSSRDEDPKPRERFTIVILDNGEVVVDFPTDEAIEVLERFADVKVVNKLCG